MPTGTVTKGPGTRRMIKFAAAGSDVRPLISADPETLVLFDEAVARPPGRPIEGTLDNIQHNLEAPTGTSAQAAVRRLRKDRPDLLAKVVAGELSPHAAAIEAGFRRRKIQIDAADPERAACRGGRKTSTRSRPGGGDFLMTE